VEILDPDLEEKTFEELLDAYERAIKRGGALVVEAEAGRNVTAEQMECFREEAMARDALIEWAERHQ
jgi:hypothetical protein